MHAEIARSRTTKTTVPSGIFAPAPQGLLLAAVRLLPVGLRRRIRFIRSTRRLPFFKKPRTYLQKLNWRMLYYHNPAVAWVCDKSEAQDRVRLLAPEVLIPRTLWSGIDLDELADFEFPQRWVFKANNRSGATYVGRGTPDLASLKSLSQHWLFSRESAYAGEWAYSLARQFFVLEEWIGEEGKDLVEYKFNVFNGKVIRIHSFRNQKTDRVESGMFDLSWNYLPTRGNFYKESYLPRPKNLDEMIAIAEKIAHGFDLLRVDLYSTAAGIYFGETTYYGGSGLTPWMSRPVDRELGKLWILPASIE
jgi:hypothetical protein